ncbi:MAG: mucoidy inhibitor MuiA family protein [Planctomycetota bacterium]|jgi:uncharacterized protein (TIGR02231 family)
MRGITVLFCVFLAAGLAGPAAGGEVGGVASRISEVTVYLDHALVTRTASARCAAGKSEMTFPGLPAEIRDSSIRVKVRGATLRGLRVERVFLERASAAEVRKLQDEIQKLRDEEKVLRDELAVLSAEAKFLRSIMTSAPERINRHLGGPEVKMPDVAVYRGTLDFIVKGLAGNAGKVREANVKLRELSPRIAAKERELREKRAGGRLEQKKVTVAVEAPAAGKAGVELSYLLPGAMWFPGYDVRADVEKGDMELVYYGVIQQATGEDWSAARLTLSATRPARRSSRPDLKPWVLGGALPPLAVRQAAQQQGWGNNADLQQRLQIKQQFAGRYKGMQKYHRNLFDNVYQVERVLRTVAARGTSVAFPVPARETVRTDGKPHRVTLAVEKMKLAPEYSAVPELSLATYVTGKAVNASKLPLLPGEASVYLGGDLIGTSTVAFVAPGEDADFYLGVDESVKVTRKLDDRLSSVRSFGKRRRVALAYTITVENFKKRAVKVAIEEALPDSQDASIKVRIARFEVEPEKSERGVTRWVLDVPAGGKRTIPISYTIDAPVVVTRVTGGQERQAAESLPRGIDRATRWIEANKKK